MHNKLEQPFDSNCCMKGRKEGVAQHLFFIKSLINIILAYIEQPKHHAVMLHTHLVGTQPIKKKKSHE